MQAPRYVLIVDDDDELRDVMSSLFESEGYLSVGAANGKVALGELESGKRFGVIVLDLMMPVMDGRSFLAHKARGAHADVPVVIFSSSPFGGLRAFGCVRAMIPKFKGGDKLLVAIQREMAEPPGGLLLQPQPEKDASLPLGK